MQSFKEWLENEGLLNEMPTISLHGVQSMMILNGEDGYLHSEPVTADLIDMRFEDWKKFGHQPPLGLKNFAAPLADGRWLNVQLNDNGYGVGTIDTQKYAAMDQSLQSKSYPEIDSNWASFSEFLNGNEITKAAPGEVNRQAAWTRKAV